MRRILTSAIFAVFLLAPGVASADEASQSADETPASAGEAPESADERSASAVIEALHDSLIAAMKEGGASPFDTRSDRLKPVIAQSFDMPLIARVAMGRRYWKRFDEAQREQLIAALWRLTVATYAGRFDNYSGESFRLISEESAPRNMVWVNSELIKSDGDAVRINYLMRSTGAGWRILDVYFKAVYSELAVRRSEYTAVYKRIGFDGLLAAIEKKIASYDSGTVK